MQCLIRTLLLVTFLLPAVSFANEQCLGTNVITDPEEFQWTEESDGHYSGTMEIAKAVLEIGGETITTRVYRQQNHCNSIPGPTIKMTPGNKYVLKFRNMLPYEPASEEHNVFKDANVSNLHTHGLHISGETPGDDVTRSFEGSAGGDFVYDIPADHMKGTYWYHAHHHGSTFLQVSAGAFGLLLIDDPVPDNNIPDTVEAMEERQLVIAYLDPAVAGTGGDTLITGTLSPTWTVNGRVNGTLTVPPNTWLRWRVLLADRDSRLKTLSVSDQCELALMARDGVWRTEVPKPLPTRSITLTGASRADLAVRCSGPATISVGSATVANVVTDGSQDLFPSPYDGGVTPWFSARPDYLRDLRSESLAHSETINMGARTINGSKWDHHMPNFTLATTGVQEFILKGATNHPFHLHVYHVQVQANCGDFENGEYYDVIAGNCTVRFDLTPNTAYWGRTVMHCHILEHEDQGAMGWAAVTVSGAKGPPVFPADFGYDPDIPPNGPPGNPPAAPSGLVATAVSSSQINLVWIDNSDNESLFRVQRSGGGSTGFVDIATTGVDSENYSDISPAAMTTYTYRVLASNDYGDSVPSNEASAETDPGGVATKLVLGGITVSAPTAGKGEKRQRADVLVLDDTGAQVVGASVDGYFSGTITTGSLTQTSGSGGVAVFETSQKAKGAIAFEFCVTRISNVSLEDFAAGPGQACANF